MLLIWIAMSVPKNFNEQAFKCVGTFKEIFDPVVEGYHKGFKVSEHKHVTDLNPSKIAAVLSASAQSKIISTRIRVARNLAMFPLNPGGTLQTRLEIAELMEKVVFMSCSILHVFSGVCPT